MWKLLRIQSSLTVSDQTRGENSYISQIFIQERKSRDEKNGRVLCAVAEGRAHVHLLAHRAGLEGQVPEAPDVQREPQPALQEGVEGHHRVRRGGQPLHGPGPAGSRQDRPDQRPGRSRECAGGQRLQRSVRHDFPDLSASRRRGDPAHALLRDLQAALRGLRRQAGFRAHALRKQADQLRRQGGARRHHPEDQDHRHRQPQQPHRQLHGPEGFRRPSPRPGCPSSWTRPTSSTPAWASRRSP